MSTVEERRPSAPATFPPLADGQRLGQAEFMRRYELTPPGFKAELIGGVVHVPSPLSRDHGRPSIDTSAWLGWYLARTPGVDALAETTTLMDELGVSQPDSQMRILPECGGQTRDEGKYVGGAPELVVEVAKSSRKIDLGPKRDDYERAGVLEYLVVTRDPDEVHWHARRRGKLKRNKPDRDGLYRSKVFPGLWLDPAALLRRDLGAVLAALDRGLASPEHADFVTQLARAAARDAAGSNPRLSWINNRGDSPMVQDVVEKVNIAEKLARFDDSWSPKIVGELNGQHVKLVKLRGEFVWHHHEHEDELFLVVKGRFRMDFRDRPVWLEPGEFLIVPRGVEHRPVAEEEAHVLLFEPASTLNTGNVRNERTIGEPERI